jgi:hypothetical protein
MSSQHLVFESDPCRGHARVTCMCSADAVLSQTAPVALRCKCAHRKRPAVDTGYLPDMFSCSSNARMAVLSAIARHKS